MNANGGSGILTIIMVFLFIVFILMPVFAIGVDKQVVTIKINTLVRSVRLITNRSYRWIKVDQASEKKIYFDKEKLREDLRLELQNNFKEDIVIEGINIFNQSEVPVEIDNQWLERPGVLVKVKFPINPIFYKSTIMNKIGGDKFYITINCIKEIPMN